MAEVKLILRMKQMPNGSFAVGKAILRGVHEEGAKDVERAALEAACLWADKIRREVLIEHVVGSPAGQALRGVASQIGRAAAQGLFDKLSESASRRRR